MAIIPSGYLNSVVSIGIRDDNNGIHWIGTGFFVGRSTDNPDKVYPMLVSNKHVFKGRDSIIIRMKKKDSDDLKELDAPLKMRMGVCVIIFMKTRK